MTILEAAMERFVQAVSSGDYETADRWAAAVFALAEQERVRHAS